ncbi:CRISPR-associated helicase Cas3' [Fuscovulum blasticum]|uniref:CRISPR-associated helicase Cas3' n=1 Tax=Fuscovulum blasticum TaxID=1075 RepID=UPI0013E0DC16|nr:CRISPR-associated helicase Cas3' [Fuscovulum blasticum]
MFAWPGKSAAEGQVPHPAVLHMLDVGAVAERLIAPFGFEPALRDALVLLVALHDLGKISDSFRAMIESGSRQTYRHWELSEALFFAHDALLGAKLGGDDLQRAALYAAVAGHHGQPSDLVLGDLGRSSRDLRKVLRQVGSGLEPAGEVIAAFSALWPRASLQSLAPGAATTALSWWVPGLCAAADWIGSNTTWFPPRAGQPRLADYLAEARAAAERAVAEAGLAGSPVQPGATFDFALRPMQAACALVALPDGPVLAVIEDETGAGKTEAALILAHRMAQAGKGRGLYFALPTMATADAMFGRASEAVGRIFAAPRLTLAHGRAALSVPFRDLPTGGAPGEDAPSCTDWLKQSRRRALLADVGVGTVDQALLSVLPVKHQTLRHFGLSSKILIVDEVHEMGEPYIGKELERLLQMHRAAGGSAILLTATLPLDLRARLLATYGGANPGPAYPALTVAGGASVTGLAADTRAVKGPVKVDRIDSAEAAADLMVAQAARGAACVWVRNGVDDAIAAVGMLRERGVAARLLHARFALNDRKRIEAEVLARVGKDGTDRAGFMLVATQVLEASLDLDFDVMVSDIAPIAALIQRAGRLWRHMDRRPAASRPVPAPVLHVLSPDPAKVTDDRWLQGTLGSGAWVYSVADVWRSARVLFAAGRIVAPQGLRALIEAVHGEGAEDVPEALARAEMEALGKAAGARTLALHNLVDLSAGYRDAGRGADDVAYPTRLGEETRVLVLARRVGAALHPWAPPDPANDPGWSDAWAFSEVAASRRKLDRLPLPDQSSPEIAAITRLWPEWKSAGTILCPVGDDGSLCEGLRYDPDCGLVFLAPD